MEIYKVNENKKSLNKLYPKEKTFNTICVACLTQTIITSLLPYLTFFIRIGSVVQVLRVNNTNTH